MGFFWPQIIGYPLVMTHRQTQFKFTKQTRCFWTAKLPGSQRIGPHNQDVVSTLVGNLLGDGWAEKRGGSTRFHLHMGSRNVDYLSWLHKFYAQRGYCSAEKPKQKQQIGKSGKIYFSYKWRTWSFCSFNWLHELFYVHCPETNRLSKRVPPNIEKLLTPRALAIWIMDDGGATSSGVGLATHGFPVEDVCLLQAALKTNFNILTKLHRKRKNATKSQFQWVIFFPKSQCPELARVVKPFMVASMYYKLGGF